MKSIILASLVVLTSNFAHGSGCLLEKPSAFQLLSSAAQDIQDASAKDYRQAVDRSSADYKSLNAIGVVTVDGSQFYGTGFLVDSCHVLTNVHVAFEDVKSARNGANVKFSVGQTGSSSKPFSETQVPGVVVAHGNYDGSSQGVNSDWTVIKLSKSVGSEVGYIPLYQMNPTLMKGHQVITAGFPGNRTNNGKDFSQIYADLNCIIGGMSAFGFVNDNCQTTGGQSGSPIMAKGNDGKYYAISMVSGDKGFPMNRSNDPSKANIAVSFDSGKSDGIISEGDKIVAALNADKCD